MSEHLQPLYYVFIFCWSRLFGTSDFALRLPSALFSISSGIAAFGAVSLLTAKGRSIWFAAVAITVSSYSLYYSQEARPYAMLQMLSFTFLLAWLHSRNSSTPGNSAVTRIALGVSGGLCLLGSPFTALLVMCIATTDLLVYKRLASWIHLWGMALAIAAGSYLAYLLPALRYMPSFLARDVISIKQPLWMNIAYTVYGVIYGTTLPPAPSLLRGSHKLHAMLSSWPVLVPTLLALSLLIWAFLEQVYWAQQIEARTKVLLLSLLTYSTVLFGFFGGVGHLNVLPRHASALFALLFTGLFSCALLPLKSGHSAVRGRFALGLFGIVLFNVFSIYEYRNDRWFAKDDYRDTAAFLKQRKIPDFMVAGQPILLARYGAASIDATGASPHTLSQFVQERVGLGVDVVLVYNDDRNYRWDFSDVNVVEAMSPLYLCNNEKQYPNIEIYSCKPKDLIRH